MRMVLAGLAAGLLTAVVGTAAESGLAAPEAKVERLAGGFEFTEGPTADRDGNVYFTDQPNNRILKWSVDGRLSTFLQPAGRANGMCFGRDGLLYACADEKMELWAIDLQAVTSPTSVVQRILVKEYQGKPLNGPNDVWAHPEGALYFTDPFYKRPWWTHNEAPQVGQHVYCLGADRQTLRRVADDLQQPNGIVGTPDGRRLYVSDIRAGKTYRYDIQADGTLTNKTLHCALGSDGMTLDERGNLYLTGKGVTVFGPTGQQLDHFDVPEGWTANACFGGSDRRTLFITASKGLYGLKMQVRGAAGPGK